MLKPSKGEIIMVTEETNVLVFDVFGDLGYFRKYFTTSSPLTFDFPPKTSLTGIIGAIIGLDYEKRYTIFQSKIGLRILNQPRKIIFGVNWLNTKWRDSEILEKTSEWFKIMGIEPTKEVLSFTGLNRHTQAGIELLIEPKYRIYYPKTNPYAEELNDMLSNHKSFYPLYLGNSEFLADYKFIGELKQKKILDSKDYVEIHSIINTELLNTTTTSPIKIKEKQKLIKINAPQTMVSDRKTIKYSDFIYDLEGNPIETCIKEYYSIKLDNMVENVAYI